MKKLIAMTLALLLFALPVLAETQVFCVGQEGDPAYAVSQLLADQLQGSVVSDADAAAAMNAFLAAPKDQAVFIGDPATLILSLQGYTDEDLRTAIVPVAKIAASPARLYATEGAIALCGTPTPEELLAFTENAPFELFIARLTDASPVDYLTLEATAMCYVDQNLYMDFAEMAQAARDGAADLCVFGAEIPAELEGLLTPLYTTELEGPFMGAFMQADTTMAAEVETALLALIRQADTQALLEAAGYIPDSCKDSAAFAEEVENLISDYIQYLTNEGLFFYEF